MNIEATVFIVDDDEHARYSVCAFVNSMSVRTKAFASAEDFLADYDPTEPGCLVTDLRMMGMSGLELQDELRQRDILLPVIILTAYSRTPITVRAMRNGALTLIEKPYNDDELWEAIRSGIALDAELRVEQGRRRVLIERLNTLTDAERDVLNLMVSGHANKTIASRLDVSIRTVENRRREVFRKMQAGSIAELVQMVFEAQSR